MGKHHLRIHRLVALAFLPNLEDKKMVDHINGDKNNNTVVNLRWCTSNENQWNCKKNKNKTSSAFKRVQPTKSGTWTASICHNNKRIHIGTFSTEIIAA